MDILDFKWAATGKVAEFPQLIVSFRLVDSQTQKTVLTDMKTVSVDVVTDAAAKEQPVDEKLFDGKGVLFPDCLASFSKEEVVEIEHTIVDAILGIYQRRVK